MTNGVGAARLNRTDWITVVALLLLAVVTRFLWLDRESIWLDEALSLSFASRLLETGTLAAFEPGHWYDPHPPLYYIVLGAWIEHFGTSEVALRGLSAVFSVLLVVAIWHFCRVIAGARAAFLCALLVVANPLLLYYAQEVRMYSPVALLMVLGTYHWYRLHTRFSIYRAVLYVAIAATMLYTHYLTAFVVSAHFAWSLVGVWRTAARRELTKLAIIGACLALLFLPWAISQLSHIPVRQIDWMSVPTPFQLLKILLEVTGAGKAAAHFFGTGSVEYLLCAWLALIVVVGGAVRAWRQGPGGRLIVAVSLVPLVLVAVSYTWTSVFNSRQASVYGPFIALLLTFALFGSDSPTRTANARRRATKSVGAAVIVAWSAVGLVGCWLTLSQLDKPDWRGLARSLEKLPASIPIVVHQFYELNTFKYYYRGHASLYGLNRERLERLGEVTDGAPRVILVIAHANLDQALEALGDEYLAGTLRQHTWMKVVELERRD